MKLFVETQLQLKQQRRILLGILFHPHLHSFQSLAIAQQFAHRRIVIGQLHCIVNVHGVVEPHFRRYNVVALQIGRAEAVRCHSRTRMVFSKNGPSKVDDFQIVSGRPFGMARHQAQLGEVL